MVDNILVDETAVDTKPGKSVFISLEKPSASVSVAPRRMTVKNCQSQSWTRHNGARWDWGVGVGGSGGAPECNALYQTQIY